MDACRQTGICLPVHAIGGIREDDIRPVLDTGVTGIALSSLLKNNDNIADKTKQVLSQLKLIQLKNG